MARRRDRDPLQFDLSAADGSDDGGPAADGTRVAGPVVSDAVLVGLGATS